MARDPIRSTIERSSDKGAGTMFTITRITAAIAVIAAAIAAGTSLAGPPAKGEVLTLRLGTPSAQGRPASRLADAFAAHVKTLSGGKLAIKVVYDAPGDMAPGTHTTPELRRLLALVRSNKLQLATIWAPSLELVGVRTIRAYQVPFLLTTKQASSRATTGTTAVRAMAGLRPAGLTGLALVPQGLSRLFRVSKPILTPADLKGVRIRTNYGSTSFAALRSLGAIPNDFDGGAFANGLSNGSIDGFEAPFEIAQQSTASSATAGNLVLYPAVTVLAASSAALAKLTSNQQSILLRAATRARASTLAAWDDARDTRSYCAAGRRNVRATTAQQTAMARLGLKAETLFARDPATAAVIDAIKTKRSAKLPLTAPCGSKLPKPVSDPGVPTAELPPSGVYRLTLEPEVMRVAGADSEAIRLHSGAETLTFQGRSGNDSTKNDRAATSCDFTLSIAKQFVRLDYDANSECAGSPLFMQWRNDGRDLRMTWFYDDKRPFSGWEALYNTVWTRAA